jgi:hypothetical protein
MPKRVGKTDEEAEERRHVRCLAYLLVGPTGVAKALDLLVGDAVGGSRDGSGEFQEQALRRIQARGVEVTVAKRFRHPAEPLALQLQEPRVRAESIPASVDGGYV